MFTSFLTTSNFYSIFHKIASTVDFREKHCAIIEYLPVVLNDPKTRGAQDVDAFVKGKP